MNKELTSKKEIIILVIVTLLVAFGVPFLLKEFGEVIFSPEIHAILSTQPTSGRHRNSIYDIIGISLAMIVYFVWNIFIINRHNKK